MRTAITFALGLAVTLTGAMAHAGQNGSIDVFPFGIDPDTGNRTSPDFGACQVEVTSTVDGVGRLSLGVYARLAGATLEGIAVVECYLQGIEDAPGQLPVGWTKTTTFPPGTIQVGSLSDPHLQNGQPVRRWDMAWSVGGPEDPDCQKDPLVLLAIVDLTSGPGFTTNFANNHYVSIVAGAPPSNPNFPCPQAGICNYPVFTIYCTSGGQLIINPMGISCTVAAAQSTWSRVKDLYR